jgi:phosphatidylinositol 4-kinase
MWFLCTLLGLTNPTSPYMTDPARAALARIAVKTPALVLEEEKDYASSVLEYNSVFRRDYAQAVSFGEPAFCCVAE